MDALKPIATFLVIVIVSGLLYVYITWFVEVEWENMKKERENRK